MLFHVSSLSIHFQICDKDLRIFKPLGWYDDWEVRYRTQQIPLLPLNLLFHFHSLFFPFQICDKDLGGYLQGPWDGLQVKDAKEVRYRSQSRYPSFSFCLFTSTLFPFTLRFAMRVYEDLQGPCDCLPGFKDDKKVRYAIELHYLSIFLTLSSDLR